MICENALLAGFAAQVKPVGRSIIAEVCRDLDLRLDGASPRREAPRDGQHGEPAAHPARAETVSRRAPSRFWVHSRQAEQEPDAVEEEAEAPKAEDRSRIFRFF